MKESKSFHEHLNEMNAYFAKPNTKIYKSQCLIEGTEASICGISTELKGLSMLLENFRGTEGTEDFSGVSLTLSGLSGRLETVGQPLSDLWRELGEIAKTQDSDSSLDLDRESKAAVTS
jgi:hypothetical protein